jgi:hypothetical protein
METPKLLEIIDCSGDEFYESELDEARLELAALIARIAKLEAALQQYADPENWRCDEYDRLRIWHKIIDGLELAEIALKDGDK